MPDRKLGLLAASEERILLPAFSKGEHFSRVEQFSLATLFQLIN